MSLPFLIITRSPFKPSVDHLDIMYDGYSKKVERNVEGFIVSDGTLALKYVRYKNGQLEDHKE